MELVSGHLLIDPVIDVPTHTESRDDPQHAARAHRPIALGDGAHAVLEAGHGVVIDVHGQDVQGGGEELGEHGHTEGGDQLALVWLKP